MTQEEELRAAIKAARHRLAGNTLHGHWEAIHDAEALLDGRSTILQAPTREALIAELLGILRS